MFKSKLNKILVCTLLSVIFSIVATLSYIPKLLQTKTDNVWDEEAMSYNNMNFAASIALIIFFALLALIFFVKEMLALQKRGISTDKVGKRNDIIFIVFASLLVLITIIMVVQTTISYQFYKPQLLALSIAGTKKSEPFYELAMTNNNRIKYILLSMVFIYFILFLTIIITKITFNQLKRKKDAEVKQAAKLAEAK